MKQYFKLIVINLRIEALHNWPEARTIAPQVGFLSDLHRHEFHISCKKQVSHNERDIEIIMFKRDVQQYLKDKYFDAHQNIINFGPLSCESIAEELINHFDLEVCEVLEDGENGAAVVRKL